jgi:ribosomal protein S28E/S33
MGRIEKENMQLPCVLTDEEKIKYGLEQSEALQKMAECENLKKQFDTQIKADIEKHEARAHEIGHKLTSGKEFRQVECRIVRNWEEKTRVWIRTDTGEIAQQDIIPEHELQEELELQEKKTKEEQADAVANGKKAKKE